LLLFSLVIPTNAKTVSGDVRLSGQYSEAILTSFAISPHARGWMGISLNSKDMYDNEQALKIHLYQDTNWGKFQKELLCSDKSKHSVASHGLQFRFEDKEWRAHFGMALNQQNSTRAHYWYVVLDDCSLEYQYRDNRIPKLHYELQMWNDIAGNVFVEQPAGPNGETQLEKRISLTHLSADEVGLPTLCAATLVISTLIASLMGMYIMKLLLQTGTVHAALFLVMLTAAFDAFSSICELIHLNKYRTDGIGYYWADAFATHFEAMCDSIVALLLLSIASGWTLPSDAIVIPQQATKMQSLIQGMRNPAGALISLSPSGILTLLILGLHAGLAQWGRTYNDDFDSYHALEHLPGRILMLFRMALGLFLVVASAYTRNNCPPSLQPFYGKLALVGTLWFQSLPIVTWTCNWVVPYHLRHPTVATWGAIVQSTALVLLAWLFTAHSTSYHKMSRLQNDESLTDQLAAGPSRSSATLKTWNFGKTKIRLD
jgi:hypothetical protein